MSNPETNLPSRYEIRTLGPEHAEWAGAIVAHSNIFHSTVFPVIYPDNKTARFNAATRFGQYLLEHQINSGLSLGIFDKEYQYRRADSAATGGKFYWDVEDDQATAEELLEAMDFPLVSVALAYDGKNPLDMEKLLPLIATLPAFATIYQQLEKLDPRAVQDPSWRVPTEENRLLMRNATSTRHDYEKRGLMGALARYMMRTAAARGFRGVSIDCMNDAVTHVWANPPAPFRGEIIAQFRTEDYREKGEEGEGEGKGDGSVEVNPFYPAKQLLTRVYVTLADS